MRQTRIVLALVLGAALAFGGAAHAALIAHYPLDTASGGTTPDTTSTNGPGALVGGPTPGSTGQIAQAFDFSGGTGEYVGISDPVWGKTAFTASVWFEPDGAGNQGPLAQWNNTAPHRSLLIRTDGSGNLQTYVRSGSDQAGGNRNFPTASVNSGAWNHVVVAYDGQDANAYLNGEQNTSSFGFSSPSVIGDGTQGTMAIGSRGGSERVLDGRADDVAVFDTTLSDGKIRALYTTATEPALNYHASQANQLFDRFDAGTGSTTIEGKTWRNAWGLTGGEGDVTDLGGGQFTLTLDSAGNGLTTTRNPDDAFGVDFGSSDDEGGGPGGVQPQFAAFEDTESGGIPPIDNSYPSTLGQDGTVDVEVGNYTHFRDYSALTDGPYAGRSALLSDMVLRNASGALNLSLGSLRPGTYQLTTFHHSPDFGGGSMDTRLSDANGLNQTVSTGLTVSGGTSPSDVTTQTFTIEAGGSDVTVAFQGGSDGQHNSLNGFRIEPIFLPDVVVRKTALLPVDFNDRGATGPANTQAGFNEFLIAGGAGGTMSYGPYDVTVSHPTGGTVDDRRRGQPTNTGPFTEQELLRDFIFGYGTDPADGLDVLIEGLASDELYEVILWVFDDGSAGNRLSDWYANGTLAYDDYRFNGDRVPPAPASNDIYSFRFLALSDGSGDLFLSGRAAGGGDPNVFLNALQINQVELIPEPGTLSLLALGGLALLRRRRRWRKGSASPAHGGGFRTVAVLLAALCAFGLGTAQAGIFNVDFGSLSDNGGGPGGVQAGFDPFEADEGGGNPPQGYLYSTPVGQLNTAMVKTSGYTHFRDYAAVSGGPFTGQSALLSDMVLRNTDGTLRLTLGQLKSGRYTITTYHHSTEFGGGSLDVRLSDADGLNQTVANNVPVTDGTSPASISTLSFPFEAAGSDVAIDFRGGASGQHLSLNGFEIDPTRSPGLKAVKTPVLSVDFNNRGNPGPGTTQDGFTEFLIADSTGGTMTYGSFDVTVSHPTASGIDDQRRTEPTNSGAFTQQELLRDFIFGNGTDPADGLDVLIEGLDPAATYEVTLWIFDDGSAPSRLSDWFANGVLAYDDYRFNGGDVPPAPASNAIYSFSFLTTADGAGELLLTGRAAGGNPPNVFLNAFQINQVELTPEPGTVSLLALGGLALLRRRWQSRG